MENIMAYYPQKDYYVGKQSRLPEVVVTGKKKKPYWISPKGAGNMSLTAGEAMKGVDAAIGPLMNWVTPSRYVGAVRESSNPGEFAVNMLSGKYGVTTDKYASEHPVLSTVFNVGLDSAIPVVGGARGAIKNYRYSHYLGKPVLNTPKIFPGQVGWAPKTTVSGYHASNEAVLNPNFWFNGWAQQRGAVPGFYFASGEAPEGGFLAKRPYVHKVSAEFEKPMVLIGDISTRPNSKNNVRNYIEQQARSLGADAIMYQDIRDNQLAHQLIVKTLNPDVRVNVRRNLLGPIKYDNTKGVGTGKEAVYNVTDRYLFMPHQNSFTRGIVMTNIKTPQITTENAASMTPKQWTAAQDAAIARGDMVEAQRLRDLHFKVSAPNTQIKDIQYHGSPYTFNIFDPAKRGNTDQGWFGKGYYFTPHKDYAAMYGETRPFYINAEDVYTKGVGSTWFGRESSPQAKVWLKMQDKRGKGSEAETILDDLRFSDAIRDAMPQTKPYDGIFEEVVTRNNNQMKLADAVTYDDNNVRIPLGSRDNFGVSDIRYYESPNKEAMKGTKYIEQIPSATSLDAEQQLAQRLESYIPKVGENGLVEYKPLNSNDVINIPKEAVEKQIQRYIDSGIAREDAIEYLREQFGYGAMTQNGKTFLLPEEYMITNPEYMKAHDAVHRVLRFDDSFNVPGTEGLNPNEAVAIISGEIKPSLGIQANKPLTEEMLDKWLKTTNDKITGRYGFSSKIKDKKKFLEWANKVAPVILPTFLGGTGYGLYKRSLEDNGNR